MNSQRRIKITSNSRVNVYKFNKKALKTIQKDQENAPHKTIDNNQINTESNVFAESNLSYMKKENRMISNKPLTDMSNFQKNNKFLKGNDEKINETFMQKQQQVLINQSNMSESKTFKLFRTFKYYFK